MKALYLNLKIQDLENKAKKASELLNPCRVCPRKCLVNRLAESNKTKKGFCQVGFLPVVASYQRHFGEEKHLVGYGGSGTVFFSSCNLACVYCQNYEISQLRLGQKIRIDDLAKMMIKLQQLGCHNINFVSPTIYIPQILKALPIAIKGGLTLPLVYNTGGYNSVKSLKLLKNVIDIYMPDVKYSDSKIALKYSLVPNYWEVVQKAVIEMHRQVGDLIIEEGIAKRGLLIRHLVLPENLAGTKKIMEFLAQRVSKKTYINIMDQYYPTNKAHQYQKLTRRITAKEYYQAIQWAKRAGLHRFDKKGVSFF